MGWRMAHGSEYEKIREICMRRGLEMPSYPPPPPRLSLGEIEWLRAFDELSTDRTFGMGGAGPIPFSSIRNWDVIPAERDMFERVMRQLDLFYLAGPSEALTPSLAMRLMGAD